MDLWGWREKRRMGRDANKARGSAVQDSKESNERAEHRKDICRNQTSPTGRGRSK